MDAVNARVTEPAEIVNTKSRGKRVVINFDTEYGEEAKIWCDPDDNEGLFAQSLSEGQEVMLMKGKGKNGVYYTFRDSDVENHDPTRNAGGGGQPANTSASTAEVARAHADLITSCYKYLDQRFARLEQDGEIDRTPNAEQIQKMAVSAAMEAT